MKTYLTLSDIFGEKSLEERMLDLANRLKGYRKKLNLTQLELADRSGVSYGSIKLFERTGNISLESLWLLCIALECDNELDSLFTHPKITADDIREGHL
jgi:transcriptional regulator with XRE-family HTH domain